MYFERMALTSCSIRLMMVRLMDVRMGGTDVDEGGRANKDNLEGAGPGPQREISQPNQIGLAVLYGSLIAWPRARHPTRPDLRPYGPA